MARLYASRVTPAAASASISLVGVAELREHLGRVRAERRRRARGAPTRSRVDLERQRERLRCRRAPGGSRSPASARAAAACATSCTGATGIPSRAVEPVRRRALARAARGSAAAAPRGSRAGRGSCGSAGRRRAPGSPIALAELREEPVVRGGDHQLAVGGREHLVRSDQRERGAVAAGRVAGPKRVGQLVADEREAGLEERDVDLAPAARLRALVQRGDDAERRPHAGAEVDQRGADADAGPVGLAGDADDAR